jgi:hypothetical protein
MMKLTHAQMLDLIAGIEAAKRARSDGRILYAAIAVMLGLQIVLLLCGWALTIWGGK